MQETAALEEANLWNGWRERLNQRQLDGQACMKRSEEELALALDAGGQVYVFGTGENNEFSGTAIPPKSVLCCHSAVVYARRLWQ